MDLTDGDLKRGRRRDLARCLRAAAVAASVLLVTAVAAVSIWSHTSPAATSLAQPVPNPHGPYTSDTDSCASCHRSHDGQSNNLLTMAQPQSALCFSCHDGTGSTYNVAAQYSDPTVPADSAGFSAFYSHPATIPSVHTSGSIDEFASTLNRHSECGDCHDPHDLSSVAPVQTGSGWMASGALAETAGVAATSPLSWTDPLTFEYELCLKCHSGYTQLLGYSKESYKKSDKAAEFDPSSSSYHPVEAPGTNTTSAMANSLAGGSLWQFGVGSTIRCTNCHGNYRLVSDPPTSGSPAHDGVLAPHTSRYRSLLIANYRDRDLKPEGEAYISGDFALCYLCHSEAPFSSGSNQETNFGDHEKHLTGIDKDGDPGLGRDIDTAGAGQGNAICAECHYELHGTSLTTWSTGQDNERLVNFSPNVEPVSGNLEPIWSLNDRSCTLVCHSKKHDPKDY